MKQKTRTSMHPNGSSQIEKHNVAATLQLCCSVLWLFLHPVCVFCESVYALGYFLTLTVQSHDLFWQRVLGS